jgi:hypothetical protein
MDPIDRTALCFRTALQLRMPELTRRRHPEATHGADPTYRRWPN